MLLPLKGRQPQGDLRQQRVDGGVVLGVIARTQGIQANGAEHGTGIDIDVPELCRQTAGQRRLARTCGPIDRN